MTKKIGAGHKHAMNKIEEGSIEFIAHPQRGHREEPALEVDRFFILLAPEGKAGRLIEVGRKRTPEIELSRASTAHHLWGVVRMIGEDRDTIKRRLAEEYGDGPEAKNIGEGRYVINDHGNHSDFVFSIEVPGKAAEEARHIGLESDQELILTIQNPETWTPKDFPATDKKPAYPDGFADMFDGSRFIKLADAALLDYEGAVAVLMTPNPRLIHAEFKFFIDEDREAAAAEEALAYLHQQRA